MSLAQGVQVTEQRHEDAGAREIGADELDVPDATSGNYAEATQFELRDFDGYTFDRFVGNVAQQEGIGFENHREDVRLLHRADWLDDDEYGANYGLLLVWPDETLMFVGSDPTANGPPWFAYTVDPLEPVPAPTTAQDALDRLKPPAVRDVIHEDGFVPKRHGEWWLRPTPLAPTVTFKPGVGSKPYGPSPLGNHVPTEWGITVPGDVFVQTAREAVCDYLPSSVQTPPEVIDWSVRQINKDGHDLEWHDVRQWAGDILVRGTVRHRDHDHPLEKLGDDWHVAETHDIEVYTADDITGVHLDYHGG
ncbi:MAG: hypothetical protein ACOCTH_03770 [Halodesulfurarchaeum sp.]